jgi:hypothetical protein
MYYHLLYLEKDDQKITYDEFIKLASIAPKKWKIMDDCDYHYLRYDDTHIYMKTYFDQLRLTRLKKKDDKLALESIMDKKRAELIKSWQSDIDNYRSEYTDAVKTYINEGKIL